MSSILPVVVPKTEREKEEENREGLRVVSKIRIEEEQQEIVDSQVGQSSDVGDLGDQVDRCDKVEHSDTDGNSRVGGNVEAVVDVTTDGEQPNDDGLGDEKFVQGIGRTQSTAMSRTVELSPVSVSARGHSHMTSALGGVGGPQKADESNKIS